MTQIISQQPRKQADFKKIIYNILLLPLALIPAIGLYLAYFFLQLYNLLNFAYLSQPPKLILLVAFIGSGILLPSLFAFGVNVIIPVANNKLKAFLFAIPVVLIHLYLYLLPLLFTGSAKMLLPYRTTGATMQIIKLAALYLPLELLTLLVISICGWLGARLRRPK